MPQHVVTKSVGVAGGNIGGTPRTVEGGLRLSFNETIPAATTNQLIPLAFTLANMISLVISSDANVTIKTNNSGTPDQTINLVGGKPMVWDSGEYYANPIEDNITALYVSAAADAILYIDVLVNGTP